MFAAIVCISPFKVIQGRWFWYHRKRICDFLLVCHCNHGPSLHRFWDMATYWVKMCPSLIRQPCSICSLWNFALKLTTRMVDSWGYPSLKTNDHSLGDFEYQAVKDRWTESIVASTVLCIASYADTLYTLTFWAYLAIKYNTFWCNPWQFPAEAQWVCRLSSVCASGRLLTDKSVGDWFARCWQYAT